MKSFSVFYERDFFFVNSANILKLFCGSVNYLRSRSRAGPESGAWFISSRTNLHIWEIKSFLSAFRLGERPVDPSSVHDDIGDIDGRSSDSFDHRLFRFLVFRFLWFSGGGPSPPLLTCCPLNYLCNPHSCFLDPLSCFSGPPCFEDSFEALHSTLITIIVPLPKTQLNSLHHTSGA